MKLRSIYERLYKKIKLFYYKHSRENILIGDDVSIRDSFRLRTAGGGYIKIGSGCFFNHDFSANAFEEISFGENCIIGENVKVYDHNHIFSCRGLIKDSGFKTGKVIVGSNVWIGSNVVLLKGTKIGDNSVIGAGCVIDSAIESNSLIKRGSCMVATKISYDKKE